MESRQNWGIGEEIISSDLNKVAGRVERGIFDYLAQEMLGRKTNAFFQDSFAATFIDSASILVKSGLGFQEIATDSFEPVNKPIYMDANDSISFSAPDSSNDRIDIVCVKAALVDGATVTRKYKDADTGAITDRSYVGSKIWQAEIVVVEGEPAGSPVVPSTPAGYLKIHEITISAATGIANQAAINDVRELLPICTFLDPIGSYEYDAVVGTIPQANYSTLEAALTAASDGWKILVLEDETIDSSPTVTNDNIEIVFKKGVTFTKGTATIGLIIQGDFCKIVNGRFKDFSSGGDYGLHLDGSDWADITGIRYNNCDNDFLDEGTNTIHLYSITE